MRLQYQLSNGSWVDCGDRTDEFLRKCRDNQPCMSESEMFAALDAGKSLRNSPNNWYSKCRDGDAIERITAKKAAKQEPALVTCSCWHAVPRISVMTASLGTSCPDCYDKMSA